MRPSSPSGVACCGGVGLIQAIALPVWCLETRADRLPGSRPPKMPLGRRKSRQRLSAGGLLSVIAAASSRADAVVFHSSSSTGPCSTASTPYPAFLALHKATSFSLGSDPRHTLNPRRKLQPETCRVRSRRCRSRLIRVLEMDRQAGEQEEAAGRWSGRPRKIRPLTFLAQAVNAAILEMCVENQGRPLAMAMTDLVERAVEAFVSGEETR